MKSYAIQKLVLSAVGLALCLVLPFLTGQIPEIGNMLCPMHLPVMLCGFLCGPVWAAVIGAVAPLMRFVLFGMPPLFPTGVAMCFELAAYGAVTGWMIRALPQRGSSIFLSLITAMIVGRVIWGLARLVLSGVTGSAFTWTIFLSAGFTTAIPGIVLQLVLLPVVVNALQKALPWLKGRK